MTAAATMEKGRPAKASAMSPVGDFAVKSRGSVDPSRHVDEIFELFSIPAYDQRQPEILPGAAIGSSKKIVVPGDVLISRIVPHIQRVWVVGPSRGYRQIASGEWIVFGNSKIEPNYLRHMLLSTPFHEQFMQTVAGMGGSLMRARPSEVERIRIPIPATMAEQHRIAVILDKADTVRRKRERALALAEDLLRSAFLEMFGDPGLNPKGWDQEPLSSQADVKIGFPFKSAEYAELGVRLCRGANTLPDRLDWSDTRFWPPSDAARFAEYALETGDIILALDRPWISSGLKVAEVVQGDLPALLVQRVARIRSPLISNNAFIFQCLRHPSFWNYCNPTETTIPHISPVELKNFPMIKPPQHLLEKFGAIAAKQYGVRRRIEDGALDATELFHSLSQRAFRGEL
jgi:type I restriction enzyme, S subunit